MNRIRSKIMFCGLIVSTLNACGQAPTAPKAEGTAPGSGKEKTTIAPIKGPVVFHSDEYNAVRISFRAPREKMQSIMSALDEDNPDIPKALLMHNRVKSLPGRIGLLRLQSSLIESCALNTNALALRVYAASVNHVMKYNQDCHGRFLTDNLSILIPELKPIGIACSEASRELSDILDKDLSEKLLNLGVDRTRFKDQMKMQPENPLIMETAFLAPLKSSMPRELRDRYELVASSVKPLIVLTKQLGKDCEAMHVKTQNLSYGALASSLDDAPFRSVNESTLIAALAVCADESNRVEAFRRAHLILAGVNATLDEPIAVFRNQDILADVTPEIAKQARQLSADIAALKGKLEEMQQFFAE